MTRKRSTEDSETSTSAPPQKKPGRVSTGSIIVANADPAYLLQRYHEGLVEEWLDSDEYELLQLIASQILSEGRGETNFAVLIEITGRSRVTLYRRLEALQKRGLVAKIRRTEGSARAAYNEYQLLDPEKGRLEAAGESALTHANGPVVGSEEQGSDLQGDLDLGVSLEYEHLVEHDRKLPIKAESLSILALFSALPSGNSGVLGSKTYTIPIRIGPDRIKLTVRPTSGMRAATVLDLRVLAAVITIVHYRLQRGHPAANPFVVELEEIVEQFRKRSPGDVRMQGGSGKRYIMGALGRWEATGFTIDHITPRTHDFYGSRIQVGKLFRMINSLSVLSVVGREGKTPERIALHLNEELLARISEPSGRYLITMSDSWLTERNPTAVKFANWARRAVRRNHQPTLYSREYLHREVDPTNSGIKVFNRLLRKLYEQFFNASYAAAYIHGYLMRPESGGKQYWIWADPEHPLLGAKSFALLQRNSKEDK